jgi:hypothetical protein
VPPGTKELLSAFLLKVRPGLVRGLLLCLIALAIAAPSAAESIPGEWSPPENLSPGPVPASSAQLAHDPKSGDLHVAWEGDTFGQKEIFGRHWVADTETWGPVENLSNFAWEDEGPALLFDQQGQGHLLWTRRYALALGAPAEGTDLIWRHWDEASWSDEEVLLHIDSFLPGAYGLILTETADDVLLFLVWPGGFRQAEYRAGSWSEFTPWDYRLDATFGQVLVDEEGTWHVAAYGPNNLETWFYDAYYTSYNGTEWSEPVNLSLTDGVASDLDMAFDSQGRLHFLWSDPGYLYSRESLESAIWERVQEDGGWTPNAKVTASNDDQAINGFSLSADANGTLHLAWSEGTIVDGGHTDLDIYHRTGDGEAWSEEQKVYTSTLMSRHPTLLTSDGDVYLVWQEGSIPYSNQYIFFSHLARVTETVRRYYLPLVERSKP